MPPMRKSESQIIRSWARVPGGISWGFVSVPGTGPRSGTGIATTGTRYPDVSVTEMRGGAAGSSGGSDEGPAGDDEDGPDGEAAPHELGVAQEERREAHPDERLGRDEGRDD